MDVSKPQMGAERMLYPAAGAAVLLISFFVSAPLLVMLFAGWGGRLVKYALTLINILEIPFLLMVLYGFWLVSRRLNSRLMEYPVYVLALIYVPFIVVDSVVTWLDVGLGRWFEALGVLFFLVEGLAFISLSVGLIRGRAGLGRYALVLGSVLFMQGVFKCLSSVFFVLSYIDPVFYVLGLVGFLSYLGGYAMNMLVYPLMVFFFHRVGGKFGGGGVIKSAD